ncbi:Membrane protein [Enterococcus mundtii 1A]|nr:Membrane protein [Enterococcus mundtii 1A]
MKEMNQIYLYDENERDFSHNGIGTLIDFVEEPEINRIINGRYSFMGVYAIEGQLADKIKKGMMIKAYCPDGTWQPFRIGKPKITLQTIEFEARHYCFDANRNFIEDLFVSSGNGTQLMQALYNQLSFDQPFQYESDLTSTHQFTAQEGHPVDILIGSNNGNQNLTGVTGGELDMHDHILTLKERLGEDRGFRVDFGINLEAIEETLADEEPPNTLYLKGATPEGDYDDPQDPVTVKFLEAPGIQITDENRVIRKYTNEECQTEQQLIDWANNVLFGKQKVHLPKVMHQISIVDLAGTVEYKDYADLMHLNIGDTVTGTLQRNGEEVSERMIEYTWFPRMSEFKEITLGNDLGFYTSQTQDGLKGAMIELNRAESSLHDKIVNASELLTGTESGNIMFYPKNRPRELRIMDTDDAASAKYVWRWNLGGLGHSSNGVNGPFPTAITADGAIVANFITAGILSGILVQGVALKTLDDQDFQVVVVGGKVSFEKKVISTGLDDVHGESLGSIVSTYGSQGINGFAIWKEPGYIFSINAADTNGTSKPVFQLPSDCTADKRKYNVYGEGIFDEGDITFRKKVTFQSDVMIGDKTLENYIKQFAGQGGGGGGNGGSWNGQYPPEITSDRDKRYWQIWAMAIGAGFTQQAAAALLGNAQGESDANPTADEGNGKPGFGYGVWQWTDSTGASSGRVYMINLMTQAGITENPDTITAQFQLLMWHAPNGQWIATNAYPYTWTQFMGLTDIATATRAFEKNFERPLNDHPERVGWSTNWYNRFKDLSIPQSAGYITPISAPVRVTSEFGWRESPITGAQEFHNGIDLVNNNPNTPIFASSEGEVIVAGAEYFSWYGNYVVLRHSDGIYTGYAHLSRVDVSAGQKVSQGQQLGLMGTTGPSTGEHLHFQFMDEFYPSSNARFHNPRNYINF